MKNIAQNNIGYTGIVTISRYSNNRKIEIAKVHNQGRNPLFDFLADCLVGDFSKANAAMPDKIRLLLKQDDGSIVPASGFIHSLTTPEKITRNNESCARYSFIITPDKIEASFNMIGLYTRSTTDEVSEYENFAACCELDLVSSGGIASLLIDWELIISNANYEETSNV